ncbi:DUF4854 domain-containing protein [bacterium 210820-DFI.6.37]|nr:DUF4854 domain-containing protein [bacterium 210820-DFI.6.37]
MKTSKRILSASLILSLLVAMTILFAGCGSTPETLEEYVNSDAEAKEMIESFSSGTDGMTVEVKDNTLIYKYTYPQTFDKDIIDQMSSQIEKTIAGSKDSFESVADTLEEGSGIENVTVKVVYEDGAGTEIYSAEY